VLQSPTRNFEGNRDGVSPQEEKKLGGMTEAQYQNLKHRDFLQYKVKYK
jgi:hypothetical protein